MQPEHKSKTQLNTEPIQVGSVMGLVRLKTQGMSEAVRIQNALKHTETHCWQCGQNANQSARILECEFCETQVPHAENEFWGR